MLCVRCSETLSTELRIDWHCQSGGRVRRRRCHHRRSLAEAQETTLPEEQGSRDQIAQLCSHRRTPQQISAGIGTHLSRFDHHRKHRARHSRDIERCNPPRPSQARIHHTCGHPSPDNMCIHLAGHRRLGRTTACILAYHSPAGSTALYNYMCLGQRRSHRLGCCCNQTRPRS